jgi:hypothetical protein
MLIDINDVRNDHNILSVRFIALIYYRSIRRREIFFLSNAQIWWSNRVHF